MDDLIARLEAAAEGSRELDARIEAAIGNWAADCEFEFGEHGGFRVYRGTSKAIDEARGFYTTSLDAALTIVPDGMWWTVAAGKTEPCEPLFGAAIYRPEYTSEPVPIEAGEHPTSGAIALCIAALKARNIHAKQK